ncbi:hypothetical protein GCM10020331_073990 [Ectobacillus funiculus]
MLTPPDNTRVAIAEKKKDGVNPGKNYNNDNTWNVLDTLYAVAEESQKNTSSSCIELAFKSTRCYSSDYWSSYNGTA